MKQYDEKTWEMITRILSNEAGPAEKEKFQQWLDRNPDEKQYFQDLKEAWKQEPKEKERCTSHLFNHEAGLKRLRSKIEKENRIKLRIKEAPSLNRSHFINWKIAASIILVLAVTSFIVIHNYWTPPVTKYATTALEQRIINLPDGSVVRLNRSSEISFRKGFAGSTRTIQLKGEAYFEVKHNAKKPFIIHTGDAVIKDIGTAFNVKEADAGNVVVAVKNGIVAVSNGETVDEEATILTKDQVALIQKDHISTIKQTNVHNYLSWINGQIIFKKTSFNQVIIQLDNIYGIHCNLSDSSLAGLKLTAYIKNTSLSDVLHMISMSLDIHYQKKGKQIVWMKGAEMNKNN
jgi:ferric-dicitrate binding protein FerR (iron transport regulator)